MTEPVLRTSVGDVPLHAYELTVAERRFSFLHTGAVVTHAEEQQFLGREGERLPYGSMLWPASIALAHELAARAQSLMGKRVLELGAGTGVPGIVAATLGAHVLQTDNSEVALHLAEMNRTRNRVTSLETVSADWTDFKLEGQFDFIIGADVLYAESLHPHLRLICERHLKANGTVLLSDPFRKQSLPMIEAMAAEGWRASLSKWTITIDGGARAIAVYELAR